MNRTQYLFKKHSSTVLTITSIGGVIGTTILAVKATPKALTLLDEAKQQKGDELTIEEIVKTAWKPYIPAMISGFSTVACILGTNYLNTKSQASLMSAYALLDNYYKEYRNQIVSTHGEETDKNAKYEIVKAKSKVEKFDISSGDLLFFDYQSMRFFESNIESVMNAECEFLKSLEDRGYACLNEYYDCLGLPHVEYGYQLGWFDMENNDPYNCQELQFKYETIDIDDGKQCMIITTNIPPATDYIL